MLKSPDPTVTDDAVDGHGVLRADGSEKQLEQRRPDVDLSAGRQAVDLHGARTDSLHVIDHDRARGEAMNVSKAVVKVLLGPGTSRS